VEADRMSRITGRMMGVMLEEAQQLMIEFLKEAADPERLMSFAQSNMGFGTYLGTGGAKQAGFDPYRVLGLEKDATDQEVKRRYSELLKKLHPDTSGTEGTRFLLQMVMAAYEIIKSERRWQR